MKITVMVENGPSVTLDIDPDESVENVKAVLESETSIASQQQQLRYSGTEMKNHEKLSGLGVRDGVVITMVPGADSSAFTSDLGFNPDHSAVNPPALQQQMQHDSNLMDQLFQEILRQRHRQRYELSYGQGEELALLHADPFGVEIRKKLEAAIHQVMLYGDMEINGVPIKAIVDTGAQSTVISKSCAERCGLLTLMAEQYKGLTHKVDQAEILGQIHEAPIKIGNVFYPCSFTVLDSPSMEFLFGLDMLQKHQCIIDLKENVLRVGGGEVSVPFLAEKDIVSHILDEDRNSKQASSPGPPPATSAAKESNVVPNGSQSAGEAVPSGPAQVPVGSPVSRSPPANTKGYGLKKWRRIKREIVKDATPNLDFTTGLKRNFTNNNFSVEMNQKSEGSVSSTNAFVKNLIGGDDSFPIIEPDNPASYKLAGGIPTFSRGTDSDNSEDRSSKSSTAASAPKFRHDLNKLSGHHPREKLRAKHSIPKHIVVSTSSSHQSFQGGMTREVDTSKKPRGEVAIMEKENSLSSLESDSRSSNTVFMREATSRVYGQSQRAMGYNGKHSGKYATEGLSTGLDNVRDEELSQQDDAELSVRVVGESKDHQISESKDPLVNCVQMLQSAQDALSREIQNFGELGKNLNPLGSDDSIKISHLCSEDVGQSVADDALKAKLIELTQKVEKLKKQVEDAKAMLNEKESMITELKQAITEQKKLEDIKAELERLFKQKIEAEVEYVAIKDSTIMAQNQVKLFADQISLGKTQAQTLRTLGNLDSKAKILKEEISGSKEVRRMQRRLCKFSSCFCVQLILLISVLELFLVQLYPKASEVIPT